MEASQKDGGGQIVLKLTYDGVTKRQRISSVSFSDLQNVIRAEFPALADGTYSVSYTDPEGDPISLANEGDLHEAILCTKESGAALKLTLVPTKSETPAKKRKPKANKKNTKPAPANDNATVNADPEAKVPQREKREKRKEKLAALVSSMAKEEAEKLGSHIKEIVDAEFRRLAPPQASTLAQSVPVEKEVHDHIACDGCNLDPIVGVRYKCTQCPDFDLCEKCEAQGVHKHHLFLKICRQDQAPLSIITQAGLAFPPPQPMPMSMPPPPPFPPMMMRGEPRMCRPPMGFLRGVHDFVRGWPRCWWGRRGKKDMGRILGDPIVNLACAPGEIVHAQWTVQNVSGSPWPVPLYIDRRRGDIEFEKMVLLSSEVGNENKLTLNVPIKAPSNVGKHKIVLIMHDESGAWIGEKLKIHLTVMSSEMKVGMINTDYFKASQLSDQGCGRFEDCLKALRECEGDIAAARAKLLAATGTDPKSAATPDGSKK